MKDIKKYEFCEIEAFLNWEEDEYDIDGIMTEVTFVDPVTGDRYWDPEFVDDEEKLFAVCMRYHKDDDEDDEAERVLDEDFCAQFRENVISDEWSKNENEQLFVQFPDKDIEGDVDFGIDDLVDGWGHEQVLEDILAEATDKDPSDWDAEFAFDKVLSLGVAYRRVTEGDPRRLDKHDMFRRWADVIGSRITEEELTDKDPGGRGVLEYAAGYVKGIEVEVTYRRYDK